MQYEYDIITIAHEGTVLSSERFVR